MVRIMVEGLHEVALHHVGADTVPGLVRSSRTATRYRRGARGLTIGGPAVARDSLFRIASITTPITAAATARFMSPTPWPIVQADGRQLTRSIE
jgi:hypothetical protein